MSFFKKLFLIFYLGISVIGFVGCPEQEGPAEEVGEEIDEATEEAGEAMEEAGEEMEEIGEEMD